MPYHTKYQWGYIYAAAEVVTGVVEFLYTPTVCLEWSEEFLAQLVATDPEAIHIVLWDQAGFHPSGGDAKVPAAVRLLPFPPYCPELNPVEPLWDQVKLRLANEAWATLTVIQKAITEVLAPFWQEAARVKSLLGDTWLTQGVAAFLAQRNSAITN